MSSSLTTCSSTAEDEFSSDVFGQGGNAEVNDDGPSSSVSGSNSRKTAIDGGMKRKMTELFILTVVNIMVTVALTSFITNENARISNADELESLKKFVGKLEQQHGNAGEEKLSQFQNDQKKFLEKISEMEKQSKVSGDQLSKSQNDQKKLLKKISEMEKQSKVSGDQLSKSQNDQKKLLKKISEMEKQQIKQLSKGEKILFCILSPVAAILLHGGLDNMHLILNFVLYILRVFGAPELLGYLLAVIHSLWYCFSS